MVTLYYCTVLASIFKLTQLTNLLIPTSPINQLTIQLTISSFPEQHILEAVGGDCGIGADHGHGARPQVGAALHLAQEIHTPDALLGEVEPGQVQLQRERRDSISGYRVTRRTLTLQGDSSGRAPSPCELGFVDLAMLFQLALYNH